MENLWSEADAKTMAARYAKQGAGEDLALRIYTTRLLGGDRRLVLHGGGNSSLKTEVVDRLGDTVAALHIKGSGHDMATIEPDGLPAVRLESLRRLAALDSLADDEMVDLLRGSLLYSRAPDPSVETLLHAFLPHRYIDHTHASAVLSLTDQPDGAAICAEVVGEAAPVVPYVMSGLALARAAAEVQAAQPDCRGLILLKHGLVSFGATARESYDAMIDLVSLAEARLAKAGSKVFPGIGLPARRPTAAKVGPILRRALAVADDGAPGGWRRVVLDHRSGEAVLNFVNGAELPRYGQAGVVTPDHAIRTKGRPVLLPAADGDDLAAFGAAAGQAVADYTAGYRAYFERHNAKARQPRTMLEPQPKVLLVPGLGLFAAGRSAADAAVAADIAENAIGVISDAEAVGRFESIDEGQTFEIEYWSLEQAKLGRAVEPELAGQVVAVTGGGGAIGAATAAAFAAQGAEVAVLDLDGEAAAAVAGEFGGTGLACDVTDPADVDRAFAAIAEGYGGVDVVVSNAGAAWQGRIGEVDDALLRRSFELNFFAHQAVAQRAVAIMRQQGTGGVLLFNASKQAVNPGPDFGPYGLPKAATLFLMRQYAVDHGADGIRANAVNADRIRSGLLTEKMVRDRSKARGVTEADYMAGNLLGREVTAA
ncbi:MAG: bifunctional aldolase/short-chain dehydrogenase, partial [Alphaproteobacteria bacterium]|nr:bifunctional aldolase/short-chain dehydrogenase [Alphaproteobacteria bacterium]